MLGSLFASLFGSLTRTHAPRGASSELPTPGVLSVRPRTLIEFDYPYDPRSRHWDPKSKLYRLVASGADRYLDFLRSVAVFQPFYERIPVRESAKSMPHWVNGLFPAVDAITLYGILALHNPRRFIEVGSGNSTLFARQAIKDHRLRTSIISIDPLPRAAIDDVCDEVIRLPLEKVSRTLFDSLHEDDVIFVDNSHRAFSNSDVTVFFTEILPDLPSGLIYGLHDIFLPLDYPEEWSNRWYNEQYLLACYLLGGARGDTIVCANAFLSVVEPRLLEPLSPILDSPRLKGIERTGGAFWMRRA